MTEFNKRQTSVLESYKKPVGITPASNRLSKDSHWGRINISSGSNLKKMILDAKGNAKELRKISREQFKINSGYIEVIEYFKNMFYFRYTVIPILKDSVSERRLPKELRKISHNMVDIADALSMETLFPKLLEKGLIDGVIYLYTYKKNGLPNVIVLPEEYCQRYRETNYDTETILFDFSYFMKIESEQGRLVEQELLKMFPKEMINQYRKYKDGNDINLNYRFQELDITRAAAIPFHSEGIPPKILVSAAKENYDNTVETESLRGKGQIDSILTIEIPLDKDSIPIFDATETAQIQRMLVSQLGGLTGIKVLTTFGKANILKPQQNESVKNESVSKAYNQIFEEAMINPQLFRADTDYALSVSLNRDAGFVWTILERLMNYFNLALNKLYSFGAYEMYIQLLPITKYNFVEQQDAYRRAAEYGIGKLEAVVATGIKQSIIYDKAELEHALQLDDILKPLQSSHTRSAQELKNIKDGIKDDEEEDETLEESNSDNKTLNKRVKDEE